MLLEPGSFRFKIQDEIEATKVGSIEVLWGLYRYSIGVIGNLKKRRVVLIYRNSACHQKSGRETEGTVASNYVPWLSK